MPRIAHFQPFSGASGDMFLGALVDAGLRLDDLDAGLKGLRVDGYRIEEEEVRRGALRAVRVHVRLDAPPGPADAPSDRGSATSPPPHRNLPAILERIDSSDLPAEVRRRSAAVFRRLAEAEAHVHGVDVERVHFHEVGAVDSIVDIVGTCLGLHLLGIDEVHSEPVSVGTGWVSGSHGRLPLPAPATAELLRGLPVRQVDSRAELTTPTGAALLATLARSFGPMPPGRIDRIGYGAGDDRDGPVPNCLRVLVAEREDAARHADRVLVLETTVDDMSPEWIGHLVERLLAAGALDAYSAPVSMKKSRPGHHITVICPLDIGERILGTLFAESTSFGVRRREVDRVVLERRIRSVDTPWGPVRVKVGSLDGREVTAAPEFEDVRRASLAAGRPLKEVHQAALDSFHGRRSENTDPSAGSRPERPAPRGGAQESSSA